LETIYLLAAIVTIISPFFALYIKRKNSKYAVIIKIDNSKIQNKGDLTKIKETIRNMVNIDSDFSISFINNDKLRIKLSNEKNFLSFLKMNKKIETENSHIENIYIESNKIQDSQINKSNTVYEIKATNKSPYVRINKLDGEIRIKGRSLPENTNEFYKPIIDFLNEYNTYKLNRIAIDIELDYFNSSSGKIFLNIFKMLHEIEKNGIPVIINWYYLNEDEDMEEYGEEWKKHFDFNHFNIVRIFNENEID